MGTTKSSEKKDFPAEHCIVAILNDGKNSVVINLKKVECILRSEEDLTEFCLVSGKTLKVLTRTIKPVSDHHKLLA